MHLEGGPRRVNHAAVALSEKIFSFGGYCTGEDYATTRPMDVHVLNTGKYTHCATNTLYCTIKRQHIRVNMCLFCITVHISRI